ncbi:hypothetical protein EDC01DRAFT_761219 [Geopyxis carbonaria]|nr:hypothetical protein EDC01DRAFT_761219 [Geopyxis carbonaria]
MQRSENHWTPPSKKKQPFGGRAYNWHKLQITSQASLHAITRGFSPTNQRKLQLFSDPTDNWYRFDSCWSLAVAGSPSIQLYGHRHVVATAQSRLNGRVFSLRFLMLLRHSIIAVESSHSFLPWFQFHVQTPCSTTCSRTVGAFFGKTKTVLMKVSTLDSIKTCKTMMRDHKISLSGGELNPGHPRSVVMTGGYTNHYTTKEAMSFEAANSLSSQRSLQLSS